MSDRHVSVCVLLVSALLLAGNAQAAGISLSKTRLVFNEGANARSLGIFNRASTPWLVQVRVQGEHGEDEPSVVVTPPLFRLEAGSQNSVRILSVKSPEGWASDRESLRYIQVTAIPASHEAIDGTSQLAMAVVMRIKMFWRPKGLPKPGKQDYQQTGFFASDKGVRACNASRYFQSFNRLLIGGVAVDLNRQPSMIPPLQCIELTGVQNTGEVRWSIINDYGGDSGWFTAHVGAKKQG